MFLTVFLLSLFCLGSGALTGGFLYEYKKKKSFLGVLIFWSILSLFCFYAIVVGVLSSPTILEKLLVLIIPTSIYIYSFLSVQKDDSSLINFFKYVEDEDLIDRFFNKIGFVLKILIIIFLLFLLLFFIIKLIKFIWFY